MRSLSIFFLQCTHDHSARIRINRLTAVCQVCNWEGNFGEYQQHIYCECDQKCSRVYPFRSLASPLYSPTLSPGNGPENTQLCNFCNILIPCHEIESHRQLCPLRGTSCPFKDHGCPEEGCFVALSDLEQHMKENEDRHFTIITAFIQHLTDTETALSAAKNALEFPWTPSHRAALRNTIDGLLIVRWVKNKVLATMRENLKSKNDEIISLRIRVTNLEKKIQLLSAKIKEREFQLSLIESRISDGTMIWKIPQFSQRKADAENGRSTSLFSLPFYSGRYGYKMCLRLYIMGDGIGKGTHLSLFFVVMRGEFDNILQWPFTHKVTFKLINQAGGSDIVDTFQPDPSNSSFRKPKSDMNIASGCPQFVTHTELERGGFIVDDTIFLKCTIDITTIRHP